jgi:tRNA U55 pseudouridine synthase TruB
VNRERSEMREKRWILFEVPKVRREGREVGANAREVDVDRLEECVSRDALDQREFNFETSAEVRGKAWVADRQREVESWGTLTLHRLHTHPKSLSNPVLSKMLDTVPISSS